MSFTFFGAAKRYADINSDYGIRQTGGGWNFCFTDAGERRMRARLEESRARAQEIMSYFHYCEEEVGPNQQCGQDSVATRDGQHLCEHHMKFYDWAYAHRNDPQGLTPPDAVL